MRRIACGRDSAKSENRPSRRLAQGSRVEPGPGVGPVPVGRRRGDAEGRGRLVDRQAGEVAELDQLGLACGSSLGQPVQGLVEGQQVVVRSSAASSSGVRGRPALPIAARASARPLARALSTRMRRMASAAAAKKWPRLFQCRAWPAPDQPQVGLVDQGRRLQRLAGLLLGHPRGRQLAQLVVDQRQELLGGVRVALLVQARIRVTSVMPVIILHGRARIDGQELQQSNELAAGNWLRMQAP